MEYTAYFLRRHLTETRTKIIENKSYELTWAETVSVPVSFDRNPTEPDHKLRFIEQALGNYASLALDDKSWDAPSFKGAREVRAPAVSLPLLTPVESPAYVLAQLHARRYPTLYGDDEFTVLKVWEHWFFVTGGGYAWTKGGYLAGAYGHDNKPSKLKSLEAHVKAAKAELAEPLSSEYLHDLKASLSFKERMSGDAFPPRPLSGYPLSRGYAHIFDIPGNVEQSFLSAAVDLCRYFLHRPIWECCAYTPVSRMNTGLIVYEDDLLWRTMTLADGAHYRAAIADAYAELIVGKLRPRVKAAGFPDERMPFDASLPPQWVSPLRDNAKDLALAELSTKLIAELREEEAKGL